MIWTDSLDIAIALDEAYPDFDPTFVNFVDLRKMVIALEGFDDNEDKSGEKILEAIQMYWIEEKE
ncbi:Believed to be involved in assembly of Fe-S clusters [Bathymodiolus heckerae thiotrophic gill symbiont]|uniref:Fe-S cluster assembly protein IscX n=1 Tax=Bathymodiolus heckerae thiotrophic gill symbiont TaxID=1052212 RepID=UPI0010B2E95D|nr:Fe-S cluster assembly protein IscX [Bathymodiolus heckerae thiotrophic gill symbiont]CAC9436681.1 Protein IscX, believed to be involved in assembly of Fe-S clusters [uncultured Gammaproteobacteria bacterium]SMN13440.1 Believed to be involved in assembly of Fe-S clusters [Bathymodiolus heckerae thiotrophic gill symbiont]SMN15413.1 Believed to be involved in assembly of Fe-S clusters [uncultured Candidatus Thioglobus sp.]